MKLHIKITPKNIKDSIRKNSHRCMIADAIQRKDPDARHITVDLQTIRFSHPKSGQRFVCLTPRKAQRALIAFDQGATPEPFPVTISSFKELKVGWKANHPKASRKGKAYSKTKKRTYRPRAQRVFGLKAFQP